MDDLQACHWVMDSDELLFELNRQPELWSSLVGHRVVHRTFGQGNVVQVEVRDDTCGRRPTLFSLHVLFEDDGPKKVLDGSYLSKSFSHIEVEDRGSLPSSLRHMAVLHSELGGRRAQRREALRREDAETQRKKDEEKRLQEEARERARQERSERARREAEEKERKQRLRRFLTPSQIRASREANIELIERDIQSENPIAAKRDVSLVQRKRIIELCIAVHASKGTENNLDDPVLIVLAGIEGGRELNETELHLLRSEEQFGALATYYSHRYERIGDAWDGVKSSGFYRKALLPNEALAVTERIIDSHSGADARLLAAAWTSRGGAQADVEFLDKAENCARLALNYDHKYHPYNLLGRVHFMKKEFERGLACFEKAVEMGADRSLVDRQMSMTVRQLTSQDRMDAATYLLDLDPDRYAWARQFLT